MSDPISESEDDDRRSRLHVFRRIAPFLVIVGGLLVCWRLGVFEQLNLDALGDNRAWLSERTREHPWLSLLAYVAIYVVFVVCSVPGALIMTLTGGMLFGMWLGGAAAIVSATIGAVLTFLIGRSTFGDFVRRRAGPVFAPIMHGFEKHASTYLMTVRLIPGVPFFAVNLAAGLCRMKLSTFTLVTFIGVTPGSLIYASIGASLVALFARGEQPTLSLVMKPGVYGPLIALATLSLLPIAWRAWRKRQEQAAVG